MKATSRASANYRKRRETERFGFELYLDDDDEFKVAEKLLEMREKKQLKAYLINAIKYYSNM